MNVYPFGQSVRLEASFANALGVKTNPTTMTFQVGLITQNPPPDPTATSHVFGVDGAVINDSAGEYHYDFVPAAPGNYITRAVGTGTVAAVFVSGFRVAPLPFA